MAPPASSRVALYTRVSTSDQAEEGFSLPAQLERLRAHAKGQGWVVVGEYVDEGESGRTVKRPQYQKMMENQDKWDVILVMKMDRIHRNSRNFMAMMDNLAEQGKEFASVTESLDTSTAMGRFVMDIIQRIAQLESEQIGERVYTGMAQKAKSNKGSLGRPAPYGYEYGEDSKFVVVRAEAANVQWMFEAKRRGLSATAIAKALNEHGVTTRNHKAWTRWNVKHILDSAVYYGHLSWNGLLQENTHPAIVAEEA